MHMDITAATRYIKSTNGSIDGRQDRHHISQGGHVVQQANAEGVNPAYKGQSGSTSPENAHQVQNKVVKGRRRRRDPITGELMPLGWWPGNDGPLTNAVDVGPVVAEEECWHQLLAAC